MRRVTDKEIKKRTLSMLLAFDRWAKENKIKYFLGYGTLIGAVRHRGFIPWDDDVDLLFLREDYNKMLHLFQTEKNHISNDILIKLPSDEDYFYPFCKLVDNKTLVYEKNVDEKFQTGLWLDLFPLDYWPKMEIAEKKQLLLQRMYIRINEIFIAGHCKSFKWKSLYILTRPLKWLGDALNLNENYWKSKIMNLVPNENYDKQFIGNVIWGSYGSREKVYAEDFNECVEVEFEGGRFPAPKGYHRYLTLIYGDYMKIPSESQRCNHEFECYWKE